MSQTIMRAIDRESLLNLPFSQVKISPTDPGTILADFDSILEYFMSHKVNATEKSRLVPIDILPILNTLLIKPAKIQFKRPHIKSYPHVRGIFWLLRGSGLLTVRRNGGYASFKINVDKLHVWQKLNPVEKYFYLLELWWFRCSKELIADGHGWRDSPIIFDLFHFWNNFSKQNDLVFKDIIAYQNLIYFLGNHTVALHHLFGLIEIVEFPPRVGTGWNLKKITLTKWGQTVIAIVNNALAQRVLESKADIYNIVEKPGLLSSLMGSYFADWKFIDFPKSPQTEMKGALFFKVSLHKWSIRIAIDTSNTWEDLSDLILDAVGFDETEHLYDFEIIDDMGRHRQFIHPKSEKMHSFDELATVEIRKTWMEKGQEITYTFDYGDNWQFQLLLEEVKNEPIQKPKIIDVKGTAPKQYADDEW